MAPARVRFLQMGFERLGGIATNANGHRFAKYVQQVLGYTGVHDMKLPHRVLFNYMLSVIIYSINVDRMHLIYRLVFDQQMPRQRCVNTLWPHGLSG